MLCDWCRSKKEVKPGIRIVLQGSPFIGFECLVGPVDLCSQCQDALQTGLKELFKKLAEDVQSKLSKEIP